MGEVGVEPVLQQQLLSWATVFVGVAAILLVWVVIKSQTNKDLKRLPPGPKPTMIMGNLGDLDQVSHQGFAKMSQKLNSPLIHLWLGSVHMVVAHDTEGAKQILKVQDLNFAFRPKTTPFVELAYDNQTISFSRGQPWRHLRKVLVLELLTARRMREFQYVRVEEIRTAVNMCLEESNGERPVRIVSKLKEYMTNVFTRMMFSKSYFGPQAVGSMDAYEFQESVRMILQELGKLHLGDYIPLLKYWDVQGNIKRMRAAHQKFDKFLQGVIDERRQQLGSKSDTGNSELQDKGDFLDVLLTRSVANDEVEVTDERMKAIFQDVVGGGIDTVTGVVDWALAEIIRHPKILKKVQDELDTVVGRSRLVEEEDITNLPYLQALVKEVFRLHPPTPMLLPHQAQQACEIQGYYIPAGTQTYVNVWAIGRDPKVWENPLEFDPDRFLNSPIDIEGLDFELLPFGAGRRKCPGMNMGLLAAQFALASLIQACDWSFPQGENPEQFDMTEGIGIVSHRARQLEAIVTPRLPKHLHV